jgi:hypothetical protein
VKTGTGMPRIDVAALNLRGREAKIVARIVKSDGTLRASKPDVPPLVKVRNPDPDAFFPYTYVHENEAGRIAGEAAYVWRMVAFFVSPKSQHQCMPCTAEFGMGGEPAEQRERCKELDALVDCIVNAVPKEQWHGVRRWGQAFGYTGTPQYAPDGAVIYR